MNELYGDQVIIAVIGAWVIEKLKRASWFPFVEMGAERVNKLFATLVALLSAAGILVVSNWDAGTSTFTVSVAGLTLPNIAEFLWRAVSQYIFLKLAYKMGVKPSMKA